MKYFTVLFSFTTLISFGQITIVNSDFSDGGDIVALTNATDATIDYGSTGADQIWDFSYLVSDGQSVRDYSTMAGVSFLVDFIFGTFASANYQATNHIISDAIPVDLLSQFLPITISDIKQFSKNSNDSITSVGMSASISGTEVPFKMDTIETRYKFPLNYGDVYNSRGYLNLDMNPIYNGIWRQYRQRSSIVDGWGSITTPYGTFDALRIDHFITEIDSLMIEVGIPIWVELPIPDSHQYEWIATGEKEPILRITTTEILGNQTVTAIEYRDINSTGIEELRNEISIFPNPSSELIHITNIQFNSEYSIFSVDGKLVQVGEITILNNGIDVSALADGMYSFVLKSEDEHSRTSFLKK